MSRSLTDDLKRYVERLNCDLLGIGRVNGSAVVVCGLRILDSVIDDAPSDEYYNLVITSSRMLDEIADRIEKFIVKRGYSACAMPASLEEGFSHRVAAASAGLGFIGRSGLLITEFGPRVRLASVLTDAPLICESSERSIHRDCLECGLCIESCPAGAISEKGFDRAACEFYNNVVLAEGKRYGACGICVKVCPCRRERPKSSQF